MSESKSPGANRWIGAVALLYAAFILPYLVLTAVFVVLGSDTGIVSVLVTAPMFAVSHIVAMFFGSFLTEGVSFAVFVALFGCAVGIHTKIRWKWVVPLGMFCLGATDIAIRFLIAAGA